MVIVVRVVCCCPLTLLLKIQRQPEFFYIGRNITTCRSRSRNEQVVLERGASELKSPSTVSAVIQALLPPYQVAFEQWSLRTSVLPVVALARFFRFYKQLATATRFNGKSSALLVYFLDKRVDSVVHSQNLESRSTVVYSFGRLSTISRFGIDAIL